MNERTRRTGVWRWNEERRLRAWELIQKGWTQQRIAAALGVTQSSVSQWVARARRGGTEALKNRKPKGRASQLSPDQRAGLLERLAEGPGRFGFDGDTWTLARVAKVIEQEFGVTYQRSQVCRILKASGWSGRRAEAA